MNPVLPDVILTVGDKREKLTVDNVFEAFFATVSAGLEPSGRGSRYPVVMKKLYSGFLSPSDAPAAVAELTSVEQELQKVPTSAVIWPMNHERAFDISKQPVNQFAANARAYFTTPTGESLVTSLKDAAQSCLDQKKTLRLTTASVRKDRTLGIAVLAFGLLVAIIGYLFFREWVEVSTDVVSHEVVRETPIWRWGFYFALVGAAWAAKTYFSGIQSWSRRHKRLSMILIAAIALIIDHTIFGSF